MENLYINRFMHMFQSSWSDFADFEKIFVRISNTISGEFVSIFSHSHHQMSDFPSWIYMIKKEKAELHFCLHIVYHEQAVNLDCWSYSNPQDHKAKLW